MKEDFITHEQAIKLKELGFNWECNHFYCQPNGKELKMVCYVPMDFLDPLYHDFNNPATWSDNSAKTFSAPTLTQVQKWLREKYKLWLEPVICISNVNYYSCDIYDLKTADEYNYMDGPTSNIEYTFNTPEEALSHAIDKVIDILKQ